MRAHTLLCLALAALAHSSLAAQPGALDLSFSTDGKVTTAIGNFSDKGRAVAIQSDGKILLAGKSNGLFTLVRYKSNGTPDSTFDFDGIATAGIAGSTNNEGKSIVVLDDGRIVLAGITNNGRNDDFGLVRFNKDGSLDTTFGNKGRVSIGIGKASDEGKALCVQSDGKYVIAGQSFNGTNNDFAVVRYNTNGTLDSTFSSDGILTTDIGGSNNEGNAVCQQKDGKLVVAGYAWNGTNEDFAVVRYNTNGTPDTTFGSRGTVVMGIGNSSDIAFAALLQKDGRIVLAGQSSNGTNNDFAVARLNSNGTPDSTFDTDGKAVADFGSSDDVCTSAALQNDGMIVMGGISGKNNNLNFALARCNSDGSLDKSFDADGKVTTDFGSPDEGAYAVAIDGSGRIVAAGESSNGSNADFALARYHGTPVSGVHTAVEPNVRVKLYPNPFTRSATIEIPDERFTNGNIVIYNLAGQAVHGQILGSKQEKLYLNVPCGIYFFSIMNQSKEIIGDGMLRIAPGNF